MKGDLAELTVGAALLELGCAINSLSQSDTGWDLHVHVPESPIDARSATAPWQMSGLVAHIQVKSRTTRSFPKLKIGTVGGWDNSSRTGTPTFLFLAESINDRDDILFATPDALSDWLSGTPRPAYDQQQMSARGVRLRQFIPATFGRVLDLWVRYPRLMFETERRFTDSILGGEALTQDEASRIVTPFVLSCFRAHDIPSTNEDSSKARRMIDSVLSRLAPKWYNDEFAHRVLVDASDLAWSSGLPDGFPPAVFSTSGDPDTITEDAALAVERLIRMRT